MIADTSALIDHLRGKKLVSADATTVVTAYELLRFGIRKGPKVLGIIRDALSRLYIYPLDERASEIAAEIDASLMTNGQPVNILDVLIAGIAVRFGETVITSNKDFEKIRDVYGAPRVILI